MARILKVPNSKLPPPEKEQEADPALELLLSVHFRCFLRVFGTGWLEFHRRLVLGVWRFFNLLSLDYISRLDLPQILRRPLGLVASQFAQAMIASGHRQNLGAYGSTAADVQRGVADDQHLVSPPILIQHPPTPLEHD